MNLSILAYRLQNLLSEAKKILIVIRREPDLDQIAGALAFYLSLSQKGKEVKVVCPDKMRVEHGHLFAVDKVTDKLGKEGKNLVISFPYVEGSIEKVSYNIENDKFNLVIEGKDEGFVLNKDNIEFSYIDDAVRDIDLIITIGVSDLADLDNFQATLQKPLQEKSVIVINNSNTSQFGTVRVVEPFNISISEIITLLLHKLNLPIDSDIAENLLKGIKDKTGNFTNATADSFEAAAILLRRKTKNEVPVVHQQMPPPQKQQSFTVKKAPPDWLKPKIFRSSSLNRNNNSDSGGVL